MWKLIANSYLKFMNVFYKLKSNCELSSCNCNLMVNINIKNRLIKIYVNGGVICGSSQWMHVLSCRCLIIVGQLY